MMNYLLNHVDVHLIGQKKLKICFIENDIFYESIINKDFSNNIIIIDCIIDNLRSSKSYSSLWNNQTFSLTNTSTNLYLLIYNILQKTNIKLYNNALWVSLVVCIIDGWIMILFDEKLNIFNFIYHVCNNSPQLAMNFFEIISSLKEMNREKILESEKILSITDNLAPIIVNCIIKHGGGGDDSSTQDDEDFKLFIDSCADVTVDIYLLYESINHQRGERFLETLGGFLKETIQNSNIQKCKIILLMLCPLSEIITTRGDSMEFYKILLMLPKITPEQTCCERICQIFSNSANLLDNPETAVTDIFQFLLNMKISYLVSNCIYILCDSISYLIYPLYNDLEIYIHKNIHNIDIDIKLYSSLILLILRISINNTSDILPLLNRAMYPTCHWLMENNENCERYDESIFRHLMILRCCLECIFNETSNLEANNQPMAHQIRQSTIEFMKPIWKPILNMQEKIMSLVPILIEENLKNNKLWNINSVNRKLNFKISKTNVVNCYIGLMREIVNATGDNGSVNLFLDMVNLAKLYCTGYYSENLKKFIPNGVLLLTHTLVIITSVVSVSKNDVLYNSILDSYDHFTEICAKTIGLNFTIKGNQRSIIILFETLGVIILNIPKIFKTNPSQADYLFKLALSCLRVEKQNKTELTEICENCELCKESLKFINILTVSELTNQIIFNNFELLSETVSLYFHRWGRQTLPATQKIFSFSLKNETAETFIHRLRVFWQKGGSSDLQIETSKLESVVTVMKRFREGGPRLKQLLRDLLDIANGDQTDDSLVTYEMFLEYSKNPPAVVVID
eukprot:GHVL01030884.1.p1 GENE.GHVL01030884.1~~GHVL01030884.1.p1  ORF type:complete len:798 (+),score=230.36 GHVL01030884.1:1465-3858(+)